MKSFSLKLKINILHTHTNISLYLRYVTKPREEKCVLAKPNKFSVSYACLEDPVSFDT